MLRYNKVPQEKQVKLTQKYMATIGTARVVCSSQDGPFFFFILRNLFAFIGRHPISRMGSSLKGEKGGEETARMTGTMFARDMEETIRLAAS